MHKKEQLISYIALGAPATRRPSQVELPFVRPEIGFTPKWYHKAINIDFGKRFHMDPQYRKESLKKMRKEIDNRFPGNKIGKISDNNNNVTDLLTGLYGACTIAAIYGVPFRYEKDQWPTSEIFAIQTQEMQNLEPVDLDRNAFFQTFMKQIEWIAENEKEIHGFMNWQGVLNNAHRIRGQEIFMDFFVNPDALKNLFECVCTTMIEAAKKLQKIQKSSGVDYGFFTVSNCLVNMLSPELYEEFLLPFDKKISENFNSIGIHNCAWNADPYLNDYATVPNVSYLDMGIHSNLACAKKLFPDTRRALMYTPMDVANKTLEQIRQDLEMVAENYGPCDIVAADIEHETPDHKVLDFIKLCEEISFKNQ